MAVVVSDKTARYNKKGSWIVDITAYDKVICQARCSLGVVSRGNLSPRGFSYGIKSEEYSGSLGVR